MKKLILIAIVIFLTVNSLAQAPEKMSYQAVVRNASNSLVTNQAVGMQISILQGGATGTAVYVETQIATTNANGLVSLEIGTGTLVSGNFSTINWSGNTFYIKTETDPTGGTTYTITGTSQLMSVPYALYAKTSGSSTPGPQGIQGVAGATGAVGATGLQGIAGTNGTNGTNGTTGSQGIPGLNGTNGATGAIGPQGLKGDTGVTGATGPQGIAGTNGTNGATGPQGIQGVSGNNGTNGNNGATGIQGPQGLKGDTGAIGPQGIAGINGMNGINGTNGTDGTNGAAGLQGSQGLKGDTGVTGPQGIAGTNGADGLNGAAGIQGSQGIQGPKGDTGAIGPQGIAGINGMNGTNGTNGTDGTNGAAGLQGTQGLKGDTGVTGPQGIAGTNGTNGANGLNGAAGIQGSQGIQGLKGDTGVTGSQGIAGTNGTNGIDGTNGINGIDGADGSVNISGTTNYLVKFATDSTGGNSTIYDNGAGVGIGTSNPQSALDVNGALTLRKDTGGSSVIQTNSGDGRMDFIADRSWKPNLAFKFTNPVDSNLLVIRADGRVGIGTIPDADLDIAGNIKITDGTEGNGKVLTSDANGTATWETPTVGDITTVNAGTGLTGGGTDGNLTLNAVGANGLTTSADEIKLGGPLTQNTTISNGNYDMIHNLNGSGDFIIQDNGVSKLEVKASGEFSIAGSTVWRQSNPFGGINAILENTSTFGMFRLYESGQNSILLGSPITGSVFNEQGLYRNFRIESDTNENMFMVNAVTNRIGIGTSLPASTLHIEGDITIVDGTEGNGKVLTSDADGKATWQTPTVGDITKVNAGTGLTGGGAFGNLTLNAVGANGLTTSADDIKLGGSLTQNTTITNGNYNLINNLNGFGDFIIQDNGMDHFEVSSNGNTYIGGNTFWRSDSTSGTTIASLSTAAGNDGRFQIYENGSTSVDLDANTGFVFNQQGLDRNFRVESDLNQNMFFVDAGNDRVGIGTSSPQSSLDVNGAITLRKGSESTAQIQTDDSDTRMDFITDRDNKNNLAFKFTDTADSDLLVIRANGDVGIGTLPTEALDVNGNVTANNYKYNSTKTRSLRINPNALNHSSQGTLLSNYPTAIGFNATTTSTEYFYYSIQLPQDAIITETSTLVFDNGAGNFNVQILRSTNTGTTTYHTSANSTNSSSNQTLSGTGNIAVDNDLYSYTLKIEATSGTLTTARIRGIKITYTVDKAD